MKNNLLVLRENELSRCVRVFINLLMIFLILIFTASSVSASDEDDIWKRYGQEKLYKGDTYTVNDYKIEAYNFPELQKGCITNPGIGLKIYKNNNPTPIEEILLGPHESKTCDENKIKITAVDLPSGQVKEWPDDEFRHWGKIEVAIKRRPKFDIDISTDEEEYQQNSIIKVNIIVRNEGDGDAKNVELEYDTGGLKVDSTNIDKTRTQFTRRDPITGKLNLKTPEAIDKKETYTISATVTGEDLEGEELSETKSVSIEVIPDSGSIYVYSTPSGAKINIDGTDKGTTPRTISVLVGYHTIKLTKSGYGDYTEKIDVSAGEEKEISASLAPRAVPTARQTSTTPKTGYVSVSSTPSNDKTVVVSENLAPIATLRSTPGILDTLGRNWMLIIVSILIIIAGKKVLIGIRLKEYQKAKEARIKEYRKSKNKIIQMNDTLLKELSRVADKNAFEEIKKMKNATVKDDISEAKLHRNRVIDYMNKNY